MKIGFTFDAREDSLHAGIDAEQAAECDTADTIAAIDRTLSSLGHDIDRIGHIRNLTTRLATGER